MLEFFDSVIRPGCSSLALKSRLNGTSFLCTELWSALAVKMGIDWDLPMGDSLMALAPTPLVPVGKILLVQFDPFSCNR